MTNYSFCLVNFHLQKLIARPTPKDLKLEEKFFKQVEQAQVESRLDSVADLKANYQNPPKVFTLS
jgi:hypothetical protein